MTKSSVVSIMWRHMRPDSVNELNRRQGGLRNPFPVYKCCIPIIVTIIITTVTSITAIEDQYLNAGGKIRF